MSSDRENIIRRLILAKQLYLVGCKHAFNKNKINRMLAIHHFDNAVEIILKCIASKFNITSKRKYFYFEELIESIKKKRRIPYEDEIKSLHDLRNVVQHNAEIPSLESIERHENNVLNFMKEVLRKFFNYNYEELFLSQLIENNSIKEMLNEAERLFAKGKYIESIAKCDEALTMAVFDEGNIVHKAGLLTGHWGVSKKVIKVLSEDISKEYSHPEVKKCIKQLIGVIKNLGMILSSTQFLDEYRMEFLKHKERIKKITEGKISSDVLDLKKEAEASLNFVINLVLKWEEEAIISG